MYEERGKQEPYPDAINLIIEKAYLEKKPFAAWEESDVKYRLIFDKMEEQCEGGSNSSSIVKVHRKSKGIITYIYIYM